jgi:hypothetical protein
VSTSWARLGGNSALSSASPRYTSVTHLVTPLCYFDLRRLRAGMLALVLAACDQGIPKASGDRDVVAISKSDAAAYASVVMSDAAAVDGGVLDAGPIDAGRDAPVRNRRAIELPLDTSDEDSCIKLVVGAATEPATLCSEVDYRYWTVTRQFVRVVRAGKTVTVLDVPTRVEGFDTGATMLETRLRIAADGMSAKVDGVTAEPHARRPTHGHPVEDCTSTPPSRKQEAQERALFGRPTYGEAMRALCDARGTYDWNGTRFVRRPVE